MAMPGKINADRVVMIYIGSSVLAVFSYITRTLTKSSIVFKESFLQNTWLYSRSARTIRYFAQMNSFQTMLYTYIAVIRCAIPHYASHVCDSCKLCGIIFYISGISIETNA